MLRHLRRLTLAVAIAAPALAHAQTPDHSPRPFAVADPTWDGAAKGALVGAGAVAGLLTISYARCDAGCEAPAEGPMFAWGLSVGAGSGAAIGWLIDRLHKSSGRGRAAHAQRRAVPAVAVRADREARAVRVAWSF
jgi:hypothetical protein